jgi:transcription elongation factor SPT4
MRSSQEAVAELTSQVFEGLICLSDPSKSWVAKWQRLTQYVPGVYAVKIVGRLPDDVVQGLEEQGIKYVPRDGGEEGEEGVDA